MTTIDLDNPYQSPRYSSIRTLDVDRPWIDAVRVTHVEQKYLYRRVVFEAPVEMDLEYRSPLLNLSDTVSIDGLVAASKVRVWWFASRFDFELVSNGKRVPIVVDVQIDFSLNVRAFQVQMAGVTVYREGNHAFPPGVPQGDASG